jgi:hypothetical protein
MGGLANDVPQGIFNQPRPAAITRSVADNLDQLLDGKGILSNQKGSDRTIDRRFLRLSPSETGLGRSNARDPFVRIDFYDRDGKRLFFKPRPPGGAKGNIKGEIDDEALDLSNFHGGSSHRTNTY